MTEAIIESKGDLDSASQIANVPKSKIRSHAKWLENNFGWTIFQGSKDNYKTKSTFVRATQGTVDVETDTYKSEGFHVGKMPKHIIETESLRMTNAIIESKGDLTMACKIAQVPLSKIKGHARWLERNFGWQIVQEKEMNHEIQTTRTIQAENEKIDLKIDIFQPVVSRIRERIDSLQGFKLFFSGIEAWLKVEVVAALRGKVEALQNKGPDLLLRGGQQIELKAATDLNLSWIRGGALKYGSPCLFLGDGSNPSQIEALKRDSKINLIVHEILSDGKSEWIIGIIVPSSQ